MKNVTIRKMFAHTFLAVASFVLLADALSSCSKKDHDTPAGKSHKLVFKAVASSGCDITTAVYGTEGNIITKSSLSGTTWTSGEMTAPAGTVSANVVVGAQGVNASSTLTVQIYVDGELKKEGKSTGEDLSAQATYQF